MEPEKLVSNGVRWAPDTDTGLSTASSRVSSAASSLPKFKRTPAERLVEQTCSSTSPREFSSCIRGSTARTKSPTYLITSHQAQARRRPQVFSALVDHEMTWQAQSGFVGNEPILEQHDYNCWCEECAEARRRRRPPPLAPPAPPAPAPWSPSPPSSPSMQSSPSTHSAAPSAHFPDDDVIYCYNRFTMTPKFNDVSCGSSRMQCLPYRTSTGVTTSLTTLDYKPTPPCDRHSILKKRSVYENVNCFEEAWLNQKLMEAQGATVHTHESCCQLHDDLHFLSQPDSSRFIPASPNTVTSQACFKNGLSKRKILYNEGISDEVANKLHVKHRKHDPACSAGYVRPDQRYAAPMYTDQSQTFDNYIPHSHVSDSKYHKNCQKPVNPSMYLHGPESETVVRRDRCGLKSVFEVHRSPERMRCLTVPKKVLTSEKNIEAYLTRKGRPAPVTKPISVTHCAPRF